VTTQSQQTERVKSTKRLARIAGVLYLLIAIFSTFALVGVDGRVYVPGDGATTAANVVANAELVRLGVVADLFQATVFMFLAMIMYRLFKHVHTSAANAMVVLVAIAVGIMCLDAVFRFMSLRVATESAYAAGFGPAGVNAMVLLLMETQHYGYLIAQIFYGLWLVPLGYLAYTSRLFPRALAVVLIVGGACYILDLLVRFLAPDLGGRIHGFVVIPPTIAEVWTLGYLLIKGIRTPRKTVGQVPVVPVPASA
jgi:hypothetical protein